ncbi:MAG TPA: hypothetical protein VMV69_09960 [Pirellulales bacterium]|nr:hypothetical protein [Pirellulales bacterium]
MSTAPKPRHRWLQFKLKTLFMLVAVLAAGLGWFKWKLDRKRNELAAASKLIDRGAVLYLDFGTDPSDPSLPYRLFGERFGERWPSIRQSSSHTPRAATFREWFLA